MPFQAAGLFKKEIRGFATHVRRDGGGFYVADDVETDRTVNVAVDDEGFYVRGDNINVADFGTASVKALPQNLEDATSDELARVSNHDHGKAKPTELVRRERKKVKGSGASDASLQAKPRELVRRERKKAKGSGASDASLQASTLKEDTEVIDFSEPRTGTSDDGKFIGSRYIELGFRTNDEIGKMGADNKPRNGFKGRKIGRPDAPNGIGMVGNSKGFDTPGFSGAIIDYVLPSTPEEGFFVGYKKNGAQTSCKNCGHSVKVWKTDDAAIALVTAFREDILADQQITLGLEDKFFRTDVRLTNNGTEALTDVRYMRILNPDNTFDQAGSLAVSAVRGDTCSSCPNPHQSVIASSIPNDVYYRLVESSATVAYYSKDLSAITSFGHGDEVTPEDPYEARVYDTPASENDAHTGDMFISICFKTDTLAPGATIHYTFWTTMAAEETTGETLTSVAAVDTDHGFCSGYSCPAATMVLQIPLPVSCVGATCTDAECCSPRALCSTMDCGSAFHRKADAGSTVCTAATCTYTEETDETDRDTCCDMKCEGHDEEGCPLTRTSNPCKKYEGECKATCESFNATACPIGPMYGQCIVQGGQCVDTAVCDESFACTAGTVLKAHLTFCAGTTCVNDDCCGTPDTCPTDAAIAACEGPGETPLLGPPAVVCARTECSDGECCHTGGHLLMATDLLKKNASCTTQDCWDTTGLHLLKYGKAVELSKQTDTMKHLRAKELEVLKQHDKERASLNSSSYDGVRFYDSGGSCVYIGNKYIELGIKRAGGDMNPYYCSKPANFHGIPGYSYIQIDADYDGWATGTALEIKMNYREEHVVGYGGTSYLNGGTSARSYTEGDDAIAIISGRSGALNVEQQITLHKDQHFWKTEVKLKNTGSSSMSNVRYVRAIDNDPYNPAVGGACSTHNHRYTPPPERGMGNTGTAVECSTKANDAITRFGKNEPQHMIYYAREDATIKGWPLTPGGAATSIPYGVKASYGDHYSLPGAYTSLVWDSQKPNDPAKSDIDAYMSLCFNIPTLGANQEVVIKFWTALDKKPVLTPPGEITLGVIEDEMVADIPPFGRCSDYACTGGKVQKLRADQPVTCEAAQCTDAECCDSIDTCSANGWLCTQNSAVLRSNHATLNCVSARCDIGDLGTCCEDACETYDDTSCPTTRAGNTCAVYDGDCLPKCETRINANCPTGESKACTLTSGSCAAKGACTSSYACTGGWVHKVVFPAFCKESSCENIDCCGPRAVCPTSIYDSMCTAGRVLKMEDFTCAGTVCTDAECCRASTTTTTTTVTTTPPSTKGFVTFPYVDTGYGHSHTFLKDDAGTLVAWDSMVCEDMKCIFKYEITDRKIYVYDAAPCGGSDVYDCCLSHSGGAISNVKCSSCSGNDCLWCKIDHTGIDIHAEQQVADSKSMVQSQPNDETSCSTYTWRPMQANYCDNTYMSSCGSTCMCIAADAGTKEVSLQNVPEDGVIKEGDKTWDCRLRVNA